MEQLLADPWVLVYVVIGLVPNLLLMLWAMARLSSQVRLLFVKLNMLEGELRLLDQGVNALTDEARRTRGGAGPRPG